MNTYSFEEQSSSHSFVETDTLAIARGIFDGPKWKIWDVAGLVQLADGEVVPLGEIVVLELEVMVNGGGDVKGIGGNSIYRCINFSVDDSWGYKFWRET